MPLGRTQFSALAMAALAVGGAHAQPDAALQGRSLAATCANCHGTNGHARSEMKPLAGMPADKLVVTLSDFKSGALTATVMHQIAKGYTDEQIRLIAAYFAAQPPRP